MLALIFGITGQDGSYLAERLLAEGFSVYGVVRRSSNPSYSRIEHILPRLTLAWGDVTDAASVFRAINEVKPQVVFNLAAQSHVRVSFDEPVYTSESVGIGCLNILEAVRQLCPTAVVVQASSSEMFGNAPGPQNEDTPFAPVSPYACAKVFAHHACMVYREAYGLEVKCAIMFNHESPRRGEHFVTRKIVRSAVRIALKQDSTLCLGNIHATRDWGFAGDYVDAMFRMAMSRDAKNYVVATGESCSVRGFADRVFSRLGLRLDDYLVHSASHERPIEVHALLGDASRIRHDLAWRPTVSLDGLVEMMLESELKSAMRA